MKISGEKLFFKINLNDTFFKQNILYCRIKTIKIFRAGNIQVTNLKTLMISLSIIFIHLFAHGQNNDTIKKTTGIQELPEIFKTDNTLKLVLDNLPPNWNIRYNNDTLIFESTTNIYMLDDTTIYAMNKVSRSKLRNKNYGTPLKATLVFHTEALWSGEKVDEALRYNQIIFQQNENLLTRFQIMHLKDSLSSPGFNPDNDNLSLKEKKSIKKYFEEKAKLDKNLIRLPDFHTTNLSLFKIHTFPEQNLAYKYTPQNIVQEIEKILEIFKLYAGK